MFTYRGVSGEVQAGNRDPQRRWVQGGWGWGMWGGGGDKKRETVPNFTLSPLELFYGKTVTFLMFH